MSKENDNPFTDSDNEELQPQQNTSNFAEKEGVQPIDTKVQELEQQLAAQKVQIGELEDKMRRVQAEALNIQRRAEQNVADASKYAISNVLKDLLNVLDSFTQALNHEPKSEEAKSIHEGMQLTADLFMKSLNKNGVEIIEPNTGDDFDPNSHEAISMQKDEKTKSGAVLMVVQPGYSLQGRVIRAARVIVNQ
jgi:molecular chaperone GrpE